MVEGTCQRSVVARGPCTEVARCSCGHVHLTVGPVTLRLDEAMLSALLVTLREGVLQLEGAAAPAAPGGGWRQ